MVSKVLGLEITSKAIKIALVKNGKHPELLSCHIIPAPAGFGGSALNNNEDIKSVTLAIKEFTARDKSMSKGLEAAAVCINNQQTVVRPITLPVLPDKELNAAVEYELSQSFPGLAGTHVISFKEYSRDKKEIKGIVSFSPRQALEPYRSMMKALNYKFVYADVTANCQAKALAAFTGEGKEDTVSLLCDIGAVNTQFTIVKKKNVLHSRQIPEGDNSLREMFCDKLGVDHAEYKRLREADPQAIDLPEAELNSIFRMVYADIAEQMHQTIEFYNSGTDEQLAISNVLLLGGGSVFPQLNEYFAANLGLPVTVIKPLDMIKADRTTFIRTFSAIGAAIRED